MLGPFAIPLDEDEESVEFGLDEWPASDRDTLTAALVEGGIPHRWDGTTVFVPRDAEQVVDELLDSIESGTLVVSGAGSEAGPPEHALSTLFSAADRLAKDPDDQVGLTDLAELVDQLDLGHPPYGVPAGTWSKVIDSSGTAARPLRGRGTVAVRRHRSGAGPAVARPTVRLTAASGEALMLLAELEVWHTRPRAPTRRVALGNLVLPVDPAPGFGGVLLGAVVAHHIPEVEDDYVPDVHRLIDQIERGDRVVQPRLRHRYQVDRHGLARSTHRMLGEGDELKLRVRHPRIGAGDGARCGLCGRAPRYAEPARDRARPAQGDALARPDRPVADRPSGRDDGHVAVVARRPAGLGARRARASRRVRRRRRRRRSRRSSALACAPCIPITAATSPTRRRPSTTSPRPVASSSPRPPRDRGSSSSISGCLSGNPVGDVGEFDIQVTNRGPLVLTDALFKIVGKRGTLVKGLGAADTFESENFIGRSDDIPGHNSDNPYLVHAFFEVTRSTAGDLKDLVEVTLDAWNASLSHLLNGHSDPSDLPVATYNAEVVPR